MTMFAKFTNARIVEDDYHTTSVDNIVNEIKEVYNEFKEKKHPVK